MPATPPPPRRPRHHAVAGLVGAVALVCCGALTTPAAGLAGPDPVGTWPLPAVPTEPEVVRGFDPPDVRWGSGHRGVDLAGRPGQVVLSALPGTVTHAGPVAGVGVVVLDHGTTRTTYQPVTASVAVGDVVGTGAPIGSLGATGSHCPPAACLHWGWVEQDLYLDPLRLLGLGPVRLLPLWRELPGPRTVGDASGPLLPSPYAWWRPVADLRPGGGPAGRPGAAVRW